MSFAEVTCDWMNQVMWPVFSNGCNQCEGKARNPKWLRVLVVHGSIPIARVNPSPATRPCHPIGKKNASVTKIVPYRRNRQITFENKATKHISLNDDIILKMDQHWKMVWFCDI